MEKIYWILGSVAGTWSVVAISLALAIGGAIRSGASRGGRRSSRRAVAAARCLLPPISVLAAALIVENSWLERHEAILFRLPGAWPYLFLAAAASPVLLSGPALALASRAIRLPRTPAWPLMIGAVLVACGVLRDLQARLPAARRRRIRLVPGGPGDRPHRGPRLRARGGVLHAEPVLPLLRRGDRLALRRQPLGDEAADRDLRGGHRPDDLPDRRPAHGPALGRVRRDVLLHDPPVRDLLRRTWCASTSSSSSARSWRSTGSAWASSGPLGRAIAT